MTLQERIMLMTRLGAYMNGDDAGWLEAKEKASRENAWFIPEFIDQAVSGISESFLDQSLLQRWLSAYHVPDRQEHPKTVGVVMAGNIPLVGFHDLLCVFISGHRLLAKAASKDDVLIRHLVTQLISWEPAVANYISFAEKLSGCDAYIATGSNNSGRYFDYYFGRYPHIIRKNRTSIAVIDGTETTAELEELGKDIMLYFGLGCRNVTQLYVPEGYDFLPLLSILRNYDHFIQFHKYKHNFDYHLALLIMGNKFYMTNDSVILTENASPFSPVSQVHYRYYNTKTSTAVVDADKESVQCIVGHGYIPFGSAQRPSLSDYADGVDTMQFLLSL